MQITKLGHSCLIVEEGSARILIDPGAWTSGYEKVTGIDAILITHEHQDHVSVEAVQTLLANNLSVPIYTNHVVVELLGKVGIEALGLEDEQSAEVKGVAITGSGKEHALIHKDWPCPHNTGYFIGERFFHPGDALSVPKRPVEILALPVIAPWMKLSEGLDFAMSAKPKICIPIHDAMLRSDRMGPWRLLPQNILPKAGISFVPMEEGETKEF